MTNKINDDYNDDYNGDYGNSYDNDENIARIANAVPVTLYSKVTK